MGVANFLAKKVCQCLPKSWRTFHFPKCATILAKSFLRPHNKPFPCTSTTMQTNLALQQTRISSFIHYSLQAIAQCAILDDEEDDKKKRKKYNRLRRCRWGEYVRLNKDKPLFHRHLRMTYDSFCLLLSQIREHIEQDESMAALRGGYVIPELKLYATIRYLSGASYSDICYFCGVSSTTFYCIVWQTIHAINKAIKISFPESPESCAMTASSFENISYASAIKNCVGVLDGYLLPIVTPPKSQANNVRSYFSGHYQKYGINIQACCDADCRFTFLGIGGPGVSKDCVAVRDSGLYEHVESLPSGYICIGDCAYQPTEKLVPIFGGDLALQKDNDNFNYFASQLRIRIEMAFGLMTRKWGILQRPLTNSLFSMKHLICCIARLHNFCIDERLKTTSTPGVSSVGVNSHTASLSFTQLAYMNACAQVRSHVCILI
jgi:hypothetical protein